MDWEPPYEDWEGPKEKNEEVECTYQVEKKEQVIPAGMVNWNDAEVVRSGVEGVGYERTVES